MKELPGPPSLSEPAQDQKEQASDNSSVQHASLNTADVHTGYYKSLNPESRIPGITGVSLLVLVSFITYIICISDVIYEQTHANGQSSSDNK